MLDKKNAERRKMLEDNQKVLLQIRMFKETIDIQYQSKILRQKVKKNWDKKSKKIETKSQKKLRQKVKKIETNFFY